MLADNPNFGTNLPQALKSSFHATNEEFLKCAEKMKYHDGSTGIVGVLRDGKLTIGNVGDCRCVIINSGRAIQVICFLIYAHFIYT